MTKAGKNKKNNNGKNNNGKGLAPGLPSSAELPSAQEAEHEARGGVVAGRARQGMFGVRGSGATEELVGAVTGHLRRTRRDVEVAVLDGGQERYPLLLGVE